MPINLRFFVPKFVDIEPGLLDLFENVTRVPVFFETQCSYFRMLVTRNLSSSVVCDIMVTGSTGNFSVSNISVIALYFTLNM